MLNMIRYAHLCALSLLAASCAPHYSENSVTLSIVKVFDTKVLFEVSNASSKDLCTSNLALGLTGISTPATPVSDQQTILSNFNEPSSTDTLKEVRFRPSETTRFTTDLGKHYYSDRGITGIFDLLIPFYPCDEPQLLPITREHEEEYGPEYKADRGVKFVRSPRFMVTFAKVFKD